MEVETISTPYGGFPGDASDKEPACQCRRCRFDPWVRKIPGGGHGNLLLYSCLENHMDREAWRATIPGATELDTTEVTEHTHKETASRELS